MEEPNNNRQRNTYLVLIAAGAFILVEHYIGFWKLIGLLMIAAGIYLVRSGSEKKGYGLVIFGAFFVAGGPFAVIIGIILISLGIFYKKSKEYQHDGQFVQKQSFIGSIRYDKEPWVLQNLSVMHAIGDMRFDFSHAIQEEKEVTVILQGMIGNLHIIVPEDLALFVEGSVYIGQLDIAGIRKEGIGNKLEFKSPHYEQSDMKVKLIASYLVGEVRIKVI